jgi:hypothetical protein
MARNARSSAGNNGPDLGAKLDAVIDLLEDLFILQAMTLGVNRENIRAILGVHPRRTSKISKGVKRALKHGKEEA